MILTARSFLVPVEFFLLSFAVNIKLENRDIYKKLRAVSIIVYFSHQFVYKWIYAGFTAMKFITGTDFSNSIIYFGLTVILSAALGFLLEKLSHINKLHFIRYLYS